jgi:hypothetical protein
MSNLYRDLFKHRSVRDKLPKLETTLANPDRLELNPEVEMLLLTGRIRDESRAWEVMQEMGVKYGHEAVKLLPPPPKVNWRKRVQNWFARLEGGYTSDPHAQELYQLRREK